MLLQKVGVTGFEPATSWSQTRRSSQTEPHPVLFSFLCHVLDTNVILYDEPYFVNTFLKIFLLFFRPRFERLQILQFPIIIGLLFIERITS